MNQPPIFSLSFFPEIAQPQTCWRLVLPLIPDAGEHQYNDCDDIRRHLVQFLHGKICASRDVHMQNIQSAEQEGRDNAQVRPPDGENDQCDRQPAAVSESVVAPDAAGLVHHIVQAAESGDHAANAGCRVLIPVYADAGRVRRGGILTH